ncbi:unnamed protein product [Heligmosomoides polygyrus]|uniref:Reverse transcriptase domain-containing protein n=1 Tax=Heligmosomoides polygyrus TaxID=6339 RepID=A0A183G8B2_HELPZ|nr:unnamed protein product [Heligmosomoides polygyrus]
MGDGEGLSRPTSVEYVGLQLNLTKTMFLRNEQVSDAPFSLNGTNISKCSSYAYLGREVNMAHDLAPELRRRKRAAWGSFQERRRSREEDEERPTPCPPIRLACVESRRRCSE